MRIRELGPQLPKPDELRIFSPYSKTDLKLQEFREEVQRFERGWTTSASDNAGRVVPTETPSDDEPKPNRQDLSRVQIPTRSATFGPSLLKL